MAAAGAVGGAALAWRRKGHTASEPGAVADGTTLDASTEPVEPVEAEGARAQGDTTAPPPAG